MSQPTRYTPQQSFVGTDSWRGAELDVEFQRIKRTTDQTLDNLARIQRDDGALANASVGLDQLAPDLRPGALLAAERINAAVQAALPAALDETIDGRIQAAIPGLDGRYGRTVDWATPEAYGAVGGGVIDDRAAIQAAIDATGPGGVVCLRAGRVYGIGAPLVLGTQRKLKLNGATVRALAGFSGTALVLLREGDGTSAHAWFCDVDGGTLDGAFACDAGLEIVSGRENFITRVKTTRTRKYGIHAGSNTARSSTGAHVIDCQTWFHEEFAVVPGFEVNAADGIGVYHEACTDSYVTRTFSVGFRKGFVAAAAAGSTEYAQCHAWGRRVHGPHTHCFQAFASGCTYTACYADTPHNWRWNGAELEQDSAITEVYGWDLQAFSAFLVNNRIFINTQSAPTFGATDGVVVGVNIGAGLTLGAFGWIVGFAFSGGSASYRYAKHFGGVLTKTTIIGVNDGGSARFVDFTTGGQRIAQKGLTVEEASTFLARLRVRHQDARLSISADAAGQSADAVWETADVRRWAWRKTDEAESGSNAGSNFELRSAADNGDNLHTVMRVVRSTGFITLGRAGVTGAGLRLNTGEQTTVGAAGAAAALPATPSGYARVNLNGTEVLIPYYAVP